MPEGFLSLIVTVLPAFQEIEQRLDRETGRRFNAFKLFAMDENATSRILAFLLDPNEAHGQNDVFLRLFIQRFVPDWQRTFNYPEAHRASTAELIDVVISDGPHWLGIENKIFNAPEQNRQAERYLNSLHGVAPSQEHYRLVYLSPRGTAPSDNSLTPERSRVHGANLVCGAWTQAIGDDDQAATPSASILDWLADCRNQCRAENVAWLIRQFAAYVDAGQKESDMVDAAIVGLALKDQQNLEAALRIGKNFDEIRRNVANTFLRCVQDGVEGWARQQGEDWELVMTWPGGNWTERSDKKWLPLLLRKKAWPALVGVAIQADRNGPWEVFIGILGPTQDTWNEPKSVSQNRQFYGEQKVPFAVDVEIGLRRSPAG
jgi:PD-(D/E)XK nuclease superfamily